MKTFKHRRKVVPNNLITEEVFNKLIDKVFESVDTPYDNTQMNVVKVLLPLDVSNSVIARVINATVIDSNATAGSVASMVRRVREQEKMTSDFLKKLGES